MFSKKEFIKKSVDTITVGIKVVTFKEGDYHIVYCQALELSAYGETEAKARKRFDEEIKIFFDETSRKGTLEKLLLQLGWTLKKMPQPKYEPPKFKNRVQRHESSFTERIAIPV
jgi:predicted RNase H-like HicB family nuclease